MLDWVLTGGVKKEEGGGKEEVEERGSGGGGFMGFSWGIGRGVWCVV